MMPARSTDACAMACSANVTDSSGVAGKWMLASAIRNALIGILILSLRYPGFAGKLKACPTSSSEQGADGFDGVGLFRLLVVTPAGHAREAHGNAGAVARGTLDAFEGQLEYQLWFDNVYRAEAVDCVAADEGIHFADFFITQAGTGLGERHELAVVPDAEGVVGEEAGAAAVARLRVNEDRIHRVRLDLPFPPVAAAAG